MSTTPEHDDRMAKLTFAEVYPHYITKVEKKGGTKEELHQVIEWLTGFDGKKIQELVDDKVTFETFFQKAELNPNAHLIKGVICGYRIEEIETPLTRQVRYLDKLVDEVAKRRKMEKIMEQNFKPKGYNSVSPYFVVDGASKLMDLLVKIFDAKKLRKYEMPDGTIMHAEIKIDDSVLMFGNSSDQFPPNKLLTHIYVPNVDNIFRKAIDLGCEPLEKSKEREGDPDRRGSFRDFAGNIWSIGTQLAEE